MLTLWLVSFAFAGGKKDKTPVETPPPPVEAPAPVPEPPPEVAPPEPPPPPANNADFHATLSFADGHSVTGHVVLLQRGIDRYAEEGWAEDPKKLVVELESAAGETTKAWTELASVDVKYGAKTTISCLYESDYTPVMYMCTIDATTTAKGTDGKTYTVASRFPWKFTFDDGKSVQFALTKPNVRKPDDSGGDDENYALYGELTAEVTRLPATGVTRIAITP